MKDWRRGALDDAFASVLGRTAVIASTLVLGFLAADWPAASLEALRAPGVLGWTVPAEYGGTGLTPVDLFAGNAASARKLHFGSGPT